MNEFEEARGSGRFERRPPGYSGSPDKEVVVMGIILLILLLALIFGGLGFAVHALWIVALVLLAVWLIGFVVRSGDSARWYRW
jgi:hypothetical protein